MRIATGVHGATLAAAAAVAIIAACAGQRSQAPPATEAAAPAMQSPEEIARDDIRQYWSEIRDWRMDRGWSPEAVLNGALPQKMCAGDCGDICNVSDAICQNRDRICDIAQRLPGDSWAESKCESARRSCEEAKEACECCRESSAEDAGALAPAPQPCAP